MFVHRKQGLFLSVTVDDFKMAGNKQETAPTWKKFLKKNVDFDELTSFLDLVYFGCTQRECKPNETIIEQYTKMFESRISAGATEKLPGMAETSRRNSVVPRHGGTCSKMCWTILWIGKQESGATLQSFASLFGLSSIQTGGTRVSWRVVRSLLANCLDMLYLARIGRSDILWSVNKLARSVTKWTRSCDKRLARLISYIHHTNDYRQYCHVANTAQHCRLGLFQGSDFAGDLEDSKSTSGGVLCFLEVEHLFLSVGCARHKLRFRTVL